MPSYDLVLHRNRDNESPEEMGRRRDSAIEASAILSNHPDARDNADLYQEYSQSQDRWANTAAENERYVHNVMFTKEQMDILAERNQAAIPINVIYPAVEQGVAMMTTQRPQFRAVAREDSDVKTAKALSEIMTWAWEQADGTEHLKQAIYDYYIMGRGVLQLYIDPEKDFGKGDICITALNPLEVFPDPNSKDKLWRDAAHVLTGRVLTREQIESMWGDDKRITAILDSAQPTTDMAVMFNSDRVAVDGQVFVEDVTDNYHERFRVIERYTKVKISFMRVFEAFSGREDLILMEDYQEYLDQNAFIVDIDGNQQVVTGPEMSQWGEIFERSEQTEDPNTRVFQTDPQIDPASGMEMPGQTITITLVTYADLLEMGAIDAVKVRQPRIMLVITIGDMLYRRVFLPTEEYPIVPLNNRHLRNPYPMSDVQFVKPIQDAINRTQALMIASMNSSSNPKLLIPRGSVDKQQVEQDFAKAGAAVIEFDAEFGSPVIAQPVSLSQGYFNQFSLLVSMIEKEMGIHALMQGDSSVAPDTHKGTIAIEQFGQRRIRSKLDDIEAALRHAGKVMISFIQNLYTEEKVVRLVQPNNSVSETVANQYQYDDLGNVARVVNDITVGRYDSVIVAGSTLPSNRFALLDYYTELYKQGIIDQVEVLKKTDVVDADGVIERASMMSQLQQANAALQEELKETKGDLQTARRQEVNALKMLELVKHKASLEEPKQKINKAAQLYEERSSDMLALQKQILSSGQGTI